MQQCEKSTSVTKSEERFALMLCYLSELRYINDIIYISDINQNQKYFVGPHSGKE